MVPVKNSGIIEEGAGVYADDAVGIHEIIITFITACALSAVQLGLISGSDRLLCHLGTHRHCKQCVLIHILSECQERERQN